MTDLTDLEHTANEEARHGNREALEAAQARIAELEAQLKVARNGFDALLDLDLIPERYRDAAQQQRDEADAVLALMK